MSTVTSGVSGHHVGAPDLDAAPGTPHLHRKLERLQNVPHALSRLFLERERGSKREGTYMFYHRCAAQGSGMTCPRQPAIRKSQRWAPVLGLVPKLVCTLTSLADVLKFPKPSHTPGASNHSVWGEESGKAPCGLGTWPWVEGMVNSCHRAWPTSRHCGHQQGLVLDGGQASGRRTPRRSPAHAPGREASDGKHAILL